VRKPPPRKLEGQARGARRIAGELIWDVPGLGARLGLPAKAVYNRAARGEIPHRRLSGRLVFIKVEIERWIAGLPGVSVEEAVANVTARREAAG
jgi:hypothetical protein